MTSSLVGSEMCIRDRFSPESVQQKMAILGHVIVLNKQALELMKVMYGSCLLYTSDAADDM
eukprot:9026432-Prorocentrum_lima.AAC.1